MYTHIHNVYIYIYIHTHIHIYTSLRGPLALPSSGSSAAYTAPVVIFMFQLFGYSQVSYFSYVLSS